MKKFTTLLLALAMIFTLAPLTNASSSNIFARVEAASAETASTTMGEKNALKKANSYLDYSAFSYEGLIGQLEYEGFSNEEAVYAVDNCGADWNEQAAKKAQSYLDFSSFSRQGLIDQLEYEGFSQEQALSGVEAVGY